MAAPQTEVLITVAGLETGRFVFEPGDYVIGRDPDCTIHVDADLVSREHAKLILNYDHALIEDLGSSHGTQVNGQPVSETTRLWPNQKIQIGSATIELRRLKVEVSDGSLAPTQAMIRRALPDELLREKKYDIGKIIAQGGMGSILDAGEAAIKRRVAMKVMLDTNDPDTLARFVAEAQVTGQLEHPNIVPVHELSVDENGQPFYTMKMVRGVTLKKVLELMAASDADTLKQYPLPALLTIFQKICDAIAFAHSKGVLHRDLKPENIMLGDYGEVLVLDWGLAKVLAKKLDPEPQGDLLSRTVARTARDTAAPLAGLDATMEGAIMGTPQFMSPEQARGEIETLDARSDIYSLGAILYQILTLRPPVEGQTVEEVLRKVGSGEITAPSEFGMTTGKAASVEKGEVLEARKIRPLPHMPGSRIPVALSAVVMRALALDRAKRYQTVTAFSADLARYQTGFATEAEQANFMKQFLLLIKRNKGIFATAFTAWLIITALAVWFVINLRAKERRAVASELNAKAEAERATVAEKSAKAAEAVAVQEKEAARQSLAKSALNLAEAAQREGDGAAMQAALNDVPDDLRDSTWNYLFEQSDTSIARVRTDTTDIQSVAAHPRQPGVFAVADTNHKVTLIELRTGRRLLEFTPGFAKVDTTLRIAFSADGERIAVGQWGKDGGIVIHSARDGKKLAEWDAPASERLDFSPDGGLLLQTGTGAKQIHVWDATEGRLAWSYPTEPGRVAHGVFTPDGQQVVTAADKDNLRLVNARDGTLVRALPRSRDVIRALTMHADGTVTATGEAGTVLRFAVGDGKVLADFRAGDRRIGHVAVTPDGGRIVTVVLLPDGRQDIRLWDANNGRVVQSLLGGSGPMRGISVHPLSGELLIGGPNARAWSLTGAPENWTLPGSEETRVAFAGSDDVIFAPVTFAASGLLKLQAAKPATLWKPASGKYRLASVSADNHLAAVSERNTSVPILLLRNPGPATEQIAAFKPKFTVQLLRLSPTGDRLAVITGANSGFELLDTATGKEPVKLERKDVKMFWDLGWLDGQRLLGLVTAKADRGTPGSEEWIVVWDVTTGKILQSATNRTALGVLALAPDGKRFAEAGADKKLRIRDVATLAVQQEFRAHDGPITALAWHPTQPILATASADLSIRLWNLDTGRRLEELRGPLGAPNSLAFSPSGQRLACSAADGITRIWEPKSLNDKPAAEKATGDWEDLLAPLTPSIVTATGHGWRMEGGALLSPGKSWATLPLPGTFDGTSYQVRVKLRQLAAKGVFHVVLPVADRMTGFDLDGFGGQYTGLTHVNGKAGKDLPGAVEGKQVKDSDQHDLEVTVQLYETSAKITTTLDGQPLYEWAGPITALSQASSWATTPPGSLALGTFAADWVVYEVQAKRLEK